MRYDEYEAKIIRRAKVKKALYRFRFLILGVSAAVLLSSGGLVGSRGLVSDEITVEASYVYGEGMQYRSSAFLSDVTYEFSPLQTEDWSTEEPKRVGQYKMRSRGENSFNSYYYGGEYTFEIKPKEIVLSAAEDRITYGDEFTLHLSDSLCFGDMIGQEGGFDISGMGKAKWAVTPILEGLTVYGTDGEDVSSCYSFTVQTKDVLIDKRSVTIKTASDTKVYDGEALSNLDYEIVEGSLVDGDVMTVDEDGDPLIDVGTKSNSFGIKVKTKKGIDVTSYYGFTQKQGTLDITSRPLHFSSDDFEYVYDGTAKPIDKKAITLDENDSLVAGHTVAYSFEEGPIDVGTYPNEFDVVIYDELKNDVTDNYAIEKTYGSTEITPRPITVLSDDETLTYDGEAHSQDGFTITSGSLADKDTIAVDTYSEFTDAGEYENVLTYSLTDKQSKEDVSGNYDVTVDSGTFTVEKRRINVSLTKVEVVYDGKPHSNSYSITDGTLVGEDSLKANDVFSATHAGTYDNETTTFDVIKKDDTSNLANYEISVLGRKNAISISKRPISIDIADRSKLYDGLPIYAEDGVLTLGEYQLTEGTLAENEYLRVTGDNPKKAGLYPTKTTIKVYHQNGPLADITADTDVTSDYKITLSEGQIEITPSSFVIGTLDTERIYDATMNIPGDLNTWGIVDGTVPDGHTIEGINVTCAGINANGTYPYVLDHENMVIRDENGIDVTDSFLVAFVNNGHHTINPRPLTVTTGSDSKVYDGKPLAKNEYTVGNLVEGHAFTGTLKSITHVWQSGANTFTTWKVEDALNNVVTPNYYLDATTSEYGTLTIEPRPITLTSPTLRKTYDGLHQLSTETVTITEGTLADGDKLTVTNLKSASTYHATPECLNTFNYVIRNEDNLDVTADYEITIVYGYFEILPCPISLQVRSQHIVYDGASHNFSYSYPDDIWIVDGTLPAGHTLSATASYNNMVNAGDYHSIMQTTYTVTCPEGKCYQSDFAVTFLPGSQVIDPRPLTFQTLGGTKAYDGQPFGYGLSSDDLCWLSSGSLAPGDDYVITLGDGDEFPTDVTEGWAHIPVEKIRIMHNGTDDVTDNYAISITYGSVTIYEE